MTNEINAAFSAALELTKQGLACFPVGTNKHPTIAKGRGFYAASTHPDILFDLWSDHPGPLIGVATGTISNIDVLDVDQTPERRQWWAANRHRIPETRTHRTRSGGLHLIFQHACGLRNSAARIFRGIDTQGDGGYAIWWPASGLPVLSDAPIAPWPEWLLSQALPPPMPVSPVAVVSDGKMFRGILNVVARALEGERNHALFWAACRFAESMLARDQATALLLSTALQAGLPVAEARATIHSAYRRHARGV
jgi:hypothetical protein